MTQITKEAIEAAKAVYLECHQDSNDCYVDVWISAIIRAALPFLRIAAELEWKKYRNGDAEAVGLFGVIYTAYVSGHWRMTAGGKAGKFIPAGNNVSDAKAGAQAHYDAAILSALISSPGKDGGQEVDPAEWQRFVDGFGWQKVNDVDLAHYRDKGAQLRPLYASPQPAGAPTVEAIEAIVASAEIEWSYREDDHRYPRDFWHARISFLGYRDGWTPYGKQEQRDLPEDVKKDAEVGLRNELREALRSALTAAQSTRDTDHG